jgi:hypothetical protein
MDFGYTKDKKKYVPIRMNSDLLSKIETYQKSQGFWNTSIAIRALIDAGLSIPSQSLHNGGNQDNSEGQPFKRRWEQGKGWRTYEEIKEGE